MAQDSVRILKFKNAIDGIIPKNTTMSLQIEPVNYNLGVQEFAKNRCWAGMTTAKALDGVKVLDFTYVQSGPRIQAARLR
jgi:hypothetical protein